jgi:enterochelin esterase-like enzyme
LVLLQKQERHGFNAAAGYLQSVCINRNAGRISLISLFLARMQDETTVALLTEKHIIDSRLLQRSVTIGCFLPTHVKAPENMGLLLINDGQDMETLGLAPMLESLLANNEIEPLLCVAIHTGKDRKMEYGTAATPDYLGRGAKAGLYTRFIFEELLPFVQTNFGIPSFKEKAFAGFSLGGLSALDIVWSHPDEFSTVGVFSGSLWWRSRALGDGYNEATDRIMHRLIREGNYYPGLKFFFETGALDETMDRNNNGIIDAIDDTLGVMEELVAKGYSPQDDIHYLELADGKHDVPTWARAMPVFLKWRWGK